MSNLREKNASPSAVKTHAMLLKLELHFNGTLLSIYSNRLEIALRNLNPLNFTGLSNVPCLALHPILSDLQGEKETGLRTWAVARCGSPAGLGLHLPGFAKHQGREGMAITLHLWRRSGP